MNASVNETSLRKANPKKYIRQYFVVDIFTNDKRKFYATDDKSAWEYACKKFEKGSRVYLNAGGGVFLGATI